MNGDWVILVTMTEEVVAGRMVGGQRSGMMERREESEMGGLLDCVRSRLMPTAISVAARSFPPCVIRDYSRHDAPGWRMVKAPVSVAESAMVAVGTRKGRVLTMFTPSLRE